MANGMPLSAVVGNKKIMEEFDEIFFSVTFGGEALSLAAAVATIQEMKRKPVIDHLWTMGRRLRDGYNALVKNHGLENITECVGLPPRTVLTFKETSGQDSLALKTLLQQEAIKRGVLCSGSHNVCYSHSLEDIDRTLSVYDEALRIVADALSSGDIGRFIEGEIVQPVFRKA
jgi:glutamate-1-semialdehyde 2,1-aminomutase/spore coat polysaccharide biosynthesis protein SpsF